MKPMCNSGIFWGSVLIIIGILLIVKYVFNIQLPVFRILSAIFLIYLGIKILLGRSSCCGMSHRNSIIFSDAKFQYSRDQEQYSSVFGNGFLDLSNYDSTENKTIEVSAVFSEFKVKIKKEANWEIIANSAFGNINMPNNNRTNFGTYNYKSENFDPNTPKLIIKANSVFANIKFFY